MPNLSDLAPITTAATALSNLILVTPNSVIGYQPQNLPNEEGKQQPPSFVFQYEGDQELSSETDITDHYLEDNNAYQDQIALKPLVYSTYGFIGELNNVVPDFLKPVKVIADKLTSVTGYAPQLTVGSLVAYQQAFFLYQVAANAANAAVSAWSSISGLLGGDTQPVQNKQQLAYQKLYGYQQERRLFTVQSPWAVFQDMALWKIKVTQNGDTNKISDFQLTFKKMRFAKTDLSPGGYLSTAVSRFQGRAAQQAAPPTNLGVSSPVQGMSVADGLTAFA